MSPICATRTTTPTRDPSPSSCETSWNVARRDDTFIPWQWVFADAAVTGTTSARRGYQSAKVHIEASETSQCIYLDEIGRAARDAIEALTLGRLVDDHGKRMIGASDGFDSNLPHSKLMLGILALLHEWFVEQLRSKVNRGMIDAFLAGKNVNLPALGHKLVPIIAPNGQPICDPEGKPFMTKVRDEEEAAHVECAFHLFAEKLWNPDRIAKEFNRLKVGGSDSRDRSGMVQLLKRTTYVGVEFFRMTRKMRDSKTQKVKRIGASLRSVVCRSAGMRADPRSRYAIGTLCSDSGRSSCLHPTPSHRFAITPSSGISMRSDERGFCTGRAKTTGSG